MQQSSGSSGIVLRRGSGLPFYLQLVDQLRYLVGAGRYPLGALLPPARRLADEVGVNFNTVNRAYRQLQRDGLTRGTREKGARVGRDSVASERERAASDLPRAASIDVEPILLAALERAL